jgi:RNA recognition motif-containing protein
MSLKLFVGNLSFQVDDSELEQVFRQHGDVVSARVVMDRRSGRSKGFGFVEMGSEDQAKQAMDALNGFEVKGRPINVSIARNQQENDRGSFSGGGGGRQGYGGGGKRRSYNNDY